ncbi:MAG: hypothetical protein UY91_C0020G0014 [Parcubacteria group bacterium GW2011_GWB1_55_9]|nr:MAG: hypothetical protein UY91_C0020G0014 [Parcubacteria group bacterium GW2011_GWB1_55_9]
MDDIYTEERQKQLSAPEQNEWMKTLDEWAGCAWKVIIPVALLGVLLKMDAIIAIFS